MPTKPPTLKTPKHPLNVTGAAQIKRRLLGVFNGIGTVNGYVCSEPWAAYCLSILASGRIVQVRKGFKKVEADLHRHGIYPPGGSRSLMVEDGLTYMPPAYDGTPIGGAEDRATLRQMAGWEGSCSAAMLQRARHYGKAAE